MKKSLSRVLARMAKDGDVETVAEFIEEMIGEEAETPAEEVAEVVEAAAETEEAPVVVEAPEAKEITIDEESIAGIIERLDKLIALLTPAAGDEDPVDPVEEIAEVVEEAIEAAEAEEGISVPAEQEVAEILETILEPAVSTTLEETEGDEDPEDPEQSCTQDALRAALKAVRPALSRMSRKQRRQVCADIAARLKPQRKGSDSTYAALARTARRPAANPMDLGKRIMAARNVNYHK